MKVLVALAAVVIAAGVTVTAVWTRAAGAATTTTTPSASSPASGAARAAAPTAPGRRALVIGIDHYAPSPRWSDLDGAVNDARAMAEVLQVRYGYRKEDVTVLVDAEATHDAILAAFRRVLVDGAHQGDLGVFYYAGHGSQVKNLSSPKGQLDETIVPHDGRDIRDVELGRLAEEAAGTGLRLTMILDSCHSGTATRGLVASGRTRNGEPDLDHPISDGGPRPNPDQKGVLILSAARAEQLAGEARMNDMPHGAFTAALLDTLAGSTDDAPADAILVRAHALVKAIRPGQDPLMEGSEERKRAPLFTPPARGPAGKPVVAVASVSGMEVELLAGAAMGLSADATLVRQGKAKSSLRLTVERVLGFGRALARVKMGDGDVATVEAGDLFEIEHYALGPAEPIRVEVGDAMPLAKVLAAAKALAPLRTSKVIKLVEDPTTLDPTHVLSWRAGGWSLRGPDGTSTPLPGAPDAAKLEQALAGKRMKGEKAPCDASACLFVRLPVPLELAAALPWQDKSPEPVMSTRDAKAATYLLAGRLGAGGPEYTLVKTGVRGSDGECSADFQLPVRGRWVGVPTPGAARQAAAGLAEIAQQIGRVNFWLTFRGPHDQSGYPWRLALSSSGHEIAGATVKPEADITLELVRTGEGSEQRFPYVIAIDCRGQIDAAWPEGGRNPSLQPAAAAANQGRVTLGTVTLDRTRGRYTFILVATEEHFPSLQAVTQPAVLERDGTPRGAPLSPLGAALQGQGQTRGLTSAKKWAVQRVAFEAVSP